MAVGVPNSQTVPQHLVDDAQMQELHGGKWECARGSLWAITGARLGYSPGGYHKKALSIRNALVSKQRKMGNVGDDGRWMEVDEIER